MGSRYFCPFHFCKYNILKFEKYSIKLFPSTILKHFKCKISSARLAIFLNKNKHNLNFFLLCLFLFRNMANLAEDILHLKCFRIVDGKSLIEYFSYVRKKTVLFRAKVLNFNMCISH